MCDPIAFFTKMHKLEITIQTCTVPDKLTIIYETQDLDLIKKVVATGGDKLGFSIAFPKKGGGGTIVES